MRLLLLVGAPVFVIFAIFATGIYCGASNSDSVTEFEANWLGIEPPPSAMPDAPEPAADSPPTKPEATPVPMPVPPANTPPANSPAVAPTKPKLPIAAAEPLTGELGELLASPRVVRIKYMVDPALLVTDPDWLERVAELSAAANSSFELLFGLEVRLHGAMLWEPAGSTSEALAADLASRSRDGADLIVGLAARPVPGDPPQARDDGVVLVFADLDASDRFHRPLLRNLAASFGAEPIRERDGPAWRGGSFMTDAPVSPETLPWIDPDNRSRVLRNKARLFGSEGR